jgi:hypothetical protein
MVFGDRFSLQVYRRSDLARLLGIVIHVVKLPHLREYAFVQRARATAFPFVPLRGSHRYAYAHDVTRAGGSRGRFVLVVLTVLLALVAGSAPRADDVHVTSPPTQAAAIAAVQSSLLAVSDRPVVSPNAKLGEVQRELWATAPTRPAVNSAVSVPGDVHTPPAVLSVGLAVEDNLGRGPPSFGES